MILAYSDGGRSLSRYPGERNDCVVIALAIAFNTPYNDVRSLLESACQRRSRKGTIQVKWKSYLQGRIGKELMGKEIYTTNLMALKDGVLYDTVKRGFMGEEMEKLSWLRSCRDSVLFKK